MGFSNHYYETSDLNEGLFDFKKSPVLALVGAGFRKFKPTTMKLNKIKGLIDPANVNQITQNAFANMIRIVGADLGLWQEKSKDKGFMDKFILKLKEPFVKDFKKGILNSNLKDDFKKTFDLTPKWLIDEIDIYKTTNGGNIMLMKIVDPYDGKIDKMQLNPKNPRKIEKDAMKNMKYYIALDKKAEKWFTTKKNMSFKNYLILASKFTKDALAKEIEDEYKKYIKKEEPDKEKEERKDVKNVKDVEDVRKRTWVADITQSRYDDLLYLKSFGMKQLLGSDFDGWRTMKPNKTFEDGRVFITKDDGSIAVYKTTRGTYQVSTNDIGHEHIIKKNILGHEDFRLP